MDQKGRFEQAGLSAPVEFADGMANRTRGSGTDGPGGTLPRSTKIWRFPFNVQFELVGMNGPMKGIGLLGMRVGQRIEDPVSLDLCGAFEVKADGPVGGWRLADFGKEDALVEGSGWIKEKAVVGPAHSVLIDGEIGKAGSVEIKADLEKRGAETDLAISALNLEAVGHRIERNRLKVEAFFVSGGDGKGVPLDDKGTLREVPGSPPSIYSATTDFEAKTPGIERLEIQPVEMTGLGAGKVRLVKPFLPFAIGFGE